jgi:Flp pilus assembly protein TadB
MYVRLKSYEASAFSDHVMPYRCVHCHHETTARAFAYARGAGLSPYGLDDRGAEARADRYARANAAAQAALSIRIAPCPRCHRRDRDAVLEVYRSTLVMCAGLLALPIVLLAWSGQRWSAAAIVGLALGAVPAMLLWKHKASQLFSQQVRFDVRLEATPAITPARPRG